MYWGFVTSFLLSTNNRLYVGQLYVFSIHGGGSITAICWGFVTSFLLSTNNRLYVGQLYVFIILRGEQP